MEGSNGHRQGVGVGCIHSVGGIHKVGVGCMGEGLWEGEGLLECRGGEEREAGYRGGGGERERV